MRPRRVDLDDEYWPIRPVRPIAGGYWTPAEPEDATAIRAHLLPIGHADRLVDLVAWKWDEPATWWRRTGLATHLGDYLLDNPPNGQSVALVETPKDWLDARGEAVVIIDWRIDLVAIFDDGPDLICQSQALARRLIAAIDGRAAVRALVV